MSIETPKGWQRLSLEETGTLSTSSVDKKRASSESEVFLVNYMDVYRQDFINHRSRLMQVTATNGEIQRSHICIGDVLFTPSSETPDDIGHAAVVIDDLPRTLHSYHTVRLRPSDRFAIFTRYLGYAFKNPGLKKHFEKRATGSTRFTLSLGDFRTGEFLLPPIEEQKLITRFLDTLDTQIRRTEEVIAKLEQVKQGLLTDLLTRGIDENGELRPSPEVAPELYKDSPVGWIPSEWNAVQVKDIADVKGGKRLPSGHDYAKEKTSYRYLRVTDFFERQYRLDHLYCLNEETFTELARYEIRPGDLYISIAGSIGYAGVHQPEDLMSARVILTENAARLVLRTDAVPDYLALAINDHRVQSQIEAEKGTGGGVPKLALFRIENLWLALPGENEQKKICSRMRSVAKRNELEEFTLQKLWAQKTGLMDDLLTGRVRVTPLLEQAEQATG